MFRRISSYDSRFLICFLVVSSAVTSALSWGVIEVKNKFAGSRRSLIDLKDHDSRRHVRILASIDLPLGGSGRPVGPGLYYTKIGIGTPSKDYYLQVDTGSDLMWVNCIQCTDCPKRSSLGIDLTLYDIKDSNTGKLVNDAKNGVPSADCTTNKPCSFHEEYLDGTSTTGHYVEDIVKYDEVSGDLETSAASEIVLFGCAVTHRNLDSSNQDELDGILGFGKSDSSLISQLASSRKVKKMFAHCLEGVNGGGIFAIGHVVQPEVNMTPLVPNPSHYNVYMTDFQVGDNSLSGDQKWETMIDSGTTLAYLPEMIYEQLINELINSQQPSLRRQTVRDYTCFQYSGRLDEAFPIVTLHFEDSVTLKVYPHEYLFDFDGLQCIGWQKSNQKNMILLGDLVLSNKLVLYDLEDKTIGWTEYNCSSSIQVEDEQTGTLHSVGYHNLHPVEYQNISSGSHLNARYVIIFILLAMVLHYSEFCFSDSLILATLSCQR